MMLDIVSRLADRTSESLTPLPGRDAGEGVAGLDGVGAGLAGAGADGLGAAAVAAAEGAGVLEPPPTLIFWPG